MYPVKAVPIREAIGRIRSPAVRAAFDFWFAFREQGRFPSFDDVDPAAIKEALPYLWVLRYDRASGRFTYRIAGEEINRFYRRNLSGKPVDGLMAPELAEAFQGRARRVIENACVLHLVGKVYRSAGYEAVGERIYLPLSPARNDDGGVLGITDARGHNIKDELLQKDATRALHVIRDGDYLVYDAAIPVGAPPASGTPDRP